MSLEDKAQEHDAQVWTINNTRPPVVIFKPGEPGHGQEFCRKCGDDMHAVRRAYGFNMCTPCASAAEKKR